MQPKRKRGRPRKNPVVERDYEKELINSTRRAQWEGEDDFEDNFFTGALVVAVATAIIVATIILTFA